MPVALPYNGAHDQSLPLQKYSAVMTRSISSKILIIGILWLTYNGQIWENFWESDSLKPNEFHDATLSALLATEFVIITASDTSSGDRVITMTTFGFKLISLARLVVIELSLWQPLGWS